MWKLHFLPAAASTASASLPKMFQFWGSNGQHCVVAIGSLTSQLDQSTDSVMPVLNTEVAEYFG